MGNTNIEWAEKSWNPVTGCSEISEGCVNCYARRMAETRLRGRHGYDKDDPFGVKFWGEPRLSQPLHWRKPSRIFVVSMGDLFHEDLFLREPTPFEYRNEIFDVMMEASHHQYMILTKRPYEMLRFWTYRFGLGFGMRATDSWVAGTDHIAIGITAETSDRLEERLPYLVKIPARYRFISFEPLLEVIDIGSERFRQMLFQDPRNRRHPLISGVIVGGETGIGARPMPLMAPSSILSRCHQFGISFFFKKWGDFHRDFKGSREIYGNKYEEDFFEHPPGEQTQGENHG